MIYYMNELPDKGALDTDCSPLCAFAIPTNMRKTRCDAMPDIYADVVVDIAAGNLDRVFAYKIPERLAGQVDIGSQVMIPFGKGDRQIQGFVVNMTGQPDYDVNKIKEISQVVNSELAIESQLIRLAWQIKKVYGGTMSQALKTVIPVRRQVRAIVERTYGLNPDHFAVSQYYEKIKNDKRYEARKRLIEFFLAPALSGEDDGVSLSMEDIKAGAKSSKTVVQALVDEGILVEQTFRRYRSPVKAYMPPEAAVVLNEEQQRAVDDILNDTSHLVHLLFGVTGSGKTEVYMALIARILEKGRQAIVLIPEIALSLQTVSRFHARFGDRVAVMNSRLSDGEKYDQYLRAKRGEVDIVVGPRSALFMPFDRLGMIIVDEEHDGAYKSENTPRYHARDVAAWRVKMAGAKLVLGSATPSVESYGRAKAGIYSLHTLTSRARSGSRLPQVSVVDLREEFRRNNKGIFSGKLLKYMEEALARKEQIILFLNRRGFAGFVSCRSCGYVFKCRHCDVSMTVHTGGMLKCHYCGWEQPLPKVCPQCGSPYIAGFGLGTQKVEQLIYQTLPGVKVLRLDRDTTAQKDSMENILEKFRRHEGDILVGTQMIVKGHDFPNVTVVGVLAADLSMFSNDYMAAERTFQLLTQAAGRSGRDQKPGQVVIQTYNPEHYSIVCASRQDYLSFYRQEINYRAMMNYPPAVHMLVVLALGRDEGKVGKQIHALAAVVKDFAAKNHGGEMILVGPSDASISKGKDVYRKVFYLKHKNYSALIQAREFLEKYMRTSEYSREVSLQFDMDPMSVY